MSVGAARSVAGFVRFLRHEGYSVGIDETLDSLTVIEQCDPPEIPTLRSALRSLVCRDRDEWARFRTLFDRYWLPGSVTDAQVPASAAALIDPRLRRVKTATATTGLARALFVDPDATDTITGSAGRQETLTRTDYRFLTDARDRRRIEQLAERLALRLRKRFVRRRRVATRGRRLHLRRTLRKSLALGGLPIHRRFRVRRREPPPLVLIQDISHSMAPYTPLYTRFVRGLLRVFRDAEAFVFHTELFPVTWLYRESDSTVLRQRLEKMNRLWMGGTRIAESLARFNRKFAARMVDPRTLVIILSDGFDTDQPERLVEELAVLRQQCGKLIWLNPALRGLHSVDEEVLSRELRTSLDGVIRANDLESLAYAVECVAGAVAGKVPGFTIGRRSNEKLNDRVGFGIGL